MIVGELRHGQLTIIDRLREAVRLAEGLTDSGDLSAAARERALDCLSRFGERLRDMHASKVRAAGTSALRRAREDSGFMGHAETALGHPIEIISGIEEARLIYLGVVHSLPLNDGIRLVADIGGGSTELILGQGPKPRALESLNIGCVGLTEQFFPGGVVTREGFDKARLAARLELRPVKAFFRNAGELEAIGASGTMRATESVARELGLIEEQGLTLAAVEELIRRVLAFETVAAIELKGLSERRAQVWPGGLAIVAELFVALRMPALKVSDGALREGLLYDLLGRLQHEDARKRTVRAMASRYHVDRAQAKRVATTARSLLDQCHAAWAFPMPFSAEMLDWASRLHEIGLDISHSGFERHGAYIAENADMPGFPRAEQRLLAFLIDSQRNSINVRRQRELPRSWRTTALRLSVLLRLAVLLNRSRSTVELPPIRLTVGEDSVELAFDRDWLASNPLSVADLERERGHLAAVGYRLEFG
ncbi:MAG: Ppx/GppA phosphatase family protein [Woeseiaceae bacterium]|nr:Ppx/GppA phosphatase family protein [Woeseiaceae bacterium]